MQTVEIYNNKKSFVIEDNILPIQLIFSDDDGSVLEHSIVNLSDLRDILISRTKALDDRLNHELLQASVNNSEISGKVPENSNLKSSSSLVINDNNKMCSFNTGIVLTFTDESIGDECSFAMPILMLKQAIEFYFKRPNTIPPAS